MLASGSDAKTEALEYASGVELGDVLSEDSFDLSTVQFQGGALDFATNGVNEIAFDLSARGFNNQLSNAIAGRGRDAVIGPTLEPVRRVRVHAQTACRAANAGWIEPGRLDQHVLGLLGDHRVEAAHDAGNGDGLYGISDNEILAGELSLDAVESLDDLAFASQPHDDLAAFEQVEVEGVGGMAEFPECIVGCVGGIVDRTRAEQSQAARDVFGRGLNTDSANDAG